MWTSPRLGYTFWHCGKFVIDFDIMLFSQVPTSNKYHIYHHSAATFLSGLTLSNTPLWYPKGHNDYFQIPMTKGIVYLCIYLLICLIQTKKRHYPNPYSKAKTFFFFSVWLLYFLVLFLSSTISFKECSYDPVCFLGSWTH